MKKPETTRGSNDGPYITIYVQFTYKCTIKTPDFRNFRNKTQIHKKLKLLIDRRTETQKNKKLKCPKTNQVDITEPETTPRFLCPSF